MSPRITSHRKDILRKKEILELIHESNDSRIRALVATLFTFGKRISEIISLDRDDFEIKEPFLIVRFQVLKKRFQAESGVPQKYTKRIRTDHYLAEYIINHISRIDEGPVFVKDARRMSRFTAYRELKKLDVNIWPHLFRHSLASLMAESGATTAQLMTWFDWEKPETAMKYVRRSGLLTRELSNRKDY